MERSKNTQNNGNTATSYIVRPPTERNHVALEGWVLFRQKNKSVKSNFISWNTKNAWYYT